MAQATIAMGGVIGVGLAIPILGALAPNTSEGHASWSALDEAGWRNLQASTDTPVQIDILIDSKDAYLPRQNAPESVYGIKVKDPSRFHTQRTDIFRDGKNTLPYTIVNLGFAIFSPVCPHLGCHYEWKPELNRFRCPCHSSEFDYDGTHVAGPAARGLDPLPLRAQSGKAEIEWIRYAPTIPDRLVISYAG